MLSAAAKSYAQPAAALSRSRAQREAQRWPGEELLGRERSVRRVCELYRILDEDLLDPLNFQRTAVYARATQLGLPRPELRHLVGRLIVFQLGTLPDFNLAVDIRSVSARNPSCRRVRRPTRT